YYSVDAYKDEKLRSQNIPAWSIDSIKLLLIIVYFYAGLAKLNSDWLFKAMPLQIWLPSNYSLPLLGDLFQQPWTHYFFSWAGAIYDLTIPFLLLIKRTRVFAFVLVVVFHVLTRVLFPIGMFPYIMIASALIFFDSSLHHKILHYISRFTKINQQWFDNARNYLFPNQIFKSISVGVITLFFAVQILFPFRYTMYPGELFWTEEGYRFSWRVMLMEKAGYANFKITDSETGRSFYIDNMDFLTRFQEKQMATQPDFILEYAHFLEDYHRQQGIKNPQVYVESYVALNGRRSQPYINPEIDLTTISQSLKHSNWILPFQDEIKGI
ncbi:MAG: HTTM domain-containing protein, partial [Balneolaceae bacterium]